MRCPTCDAVFVWASGETTTLVWFYSPPGHNHDDNCRNRVYECANGHRTRLSVQNKCAKCDWRGRTECFCHPGKKLFDWPHLTNQWGIPHYPKE